MSRIIELAKLFFHLGLVAFGGPAAHIAMMHREVVGKRKWMDEAHFLDLVGATSLIPGPNSTEMVIHCGYHRGGVAGLFIAGIAFILPATILTGILAYIYVEFSKLPDFEIYLSGLKPVVIILIADALRKLWKKAIKTRELLIAAVFVFALGFIIGEVAALFTGSLLAFAYLRMLKGRSLFSIDPSIAGASIFWVFAKIGSVLFGSGYVLIAYLQDELVNKRAWLTSAQIADAVAMGQFTPGPVLSTSTFVGYLLGNTSGAVLATIGIFLPSFLFVYFLNPLIPKMRGSKNFSLLLDCVNAGAVGLMALALVQLAFGGGFGGDFGSEIGALTSYSGIATFALMGVVYWRFPKLASFWLVTLSLVVGFLITSFFNIGL